MYEYLEVMTDNTREIKQCRSGMEGEYAAEIKKVLFPAVANQLGSEGWELVNFVARSEGNGYLYVFKRLIE